MTPSTPPSKSPGAPQDFQKARRVMPMTVRGDQGLREGEVWFVEGGEITFWSAERLGEGRVYEMRVDTRARGKNADIEVKIRKVMVGRTSDAKRGYLHMGKLMPVKAMDIERLRVRFWTLNPEHAPPGMNAAGRRSPSSDVSDVSRRRRERGADTRSGVSDVSRRRRERSAATRSGVSDVHHRRSRSPREQLRAVMAKGYEHDRSQEERRIPPPAAARTPPSPPPPQRPTTYRPARTIMELAPGDPPNALLRFASSESLRADLCIRANKAIYSVAPERKLEPGTRIMLHVQLPNGAFIQMKGKVSSSDTTACVIEARSLPLATLHALEAALLAG